MVGGCGWRRGRESLETTMSSGQWVGEVGGVGLVGGWRGSGDNC
jgi:hypothetical protein